MVAVPQKISQRQLRNDSGAVLRAVEAGETFVVTSNGRPVAELRPIAADPLAGLRVQRARPGARFTDVVPETGRSDETALESLMLLRGKR
jgi:prevent-host-death family protein